MIAPVKVNIEQVEKPESFSASELEFAVGAVEPTYRVSVQVLDTDKRVMRLYSFESMRNLEAPAYRDVGSITISKLGPEDKAYLRQLRDAINEELGESE